MSYACHYLLCRIILLSPPAYATLPRGVFVYATHLEALLTPPAYATLVHKVVAYAQVDMTYTEVSDAAQMEEV